jgi:hypothetical protein
MRASTGSSWKDKSDDTVLDAFVCSYEANAASSISSIFRDSIDSGSSSERRSNLFNDSFGSA